MKKLFIWFPLILLLFSCKKVVVNSISKKFITINSILDQKYKTQIIHLSYSQGIDVEAPVIAVKEAQLKISQNGNVYQFNENDSGLYSSDGPFSLESNKAFTIEYKVDTNNLKTTYKSPAVINVDDFSYSTPIHNLLFSVNINSNASQFFTYKIFELIINKVDSINNDSIWIESNGLLPYPIHELENGDNTLYLETNNQFTSFDTGKVIRLDAYAINLDVANYFILLNNYYQTIATTSLYINPPKYYPNHFYGMTYGVYATSFIDTL